ncbi:Protein of unknown function (DUF1351) [butyrate-producing bacterium SM4/1]|nr:Protein of unknown function (DUF1351) [butyrate-producing bacterium SM4/1]
MELKIYNPQDNGFLTSIEWNFEELKAEITAASQEYAASVYTDENIRGAKADRAKLNKFVDALNGKRTEIRKKLLAPDEQFGREVKELTGIIQGAIENIDAQIKDYERRQREEKTKKVREIYEDNIQDLEKYLPFERVFRPEFANAGTTLKSIREEITGKIQQVAEGLAVLNEIDSPYAEEMKESFLKSYDLNTALAEGNRLAAAEQRRKEYAAAQEKERAEREARRKEEASRVIAAGREEKPREQNGNLAAGVREETCAAEQKTEEEVVEKPVHILDFRVHATAEQLTGLRRYLKENRIRFERVPEK